LNARDDSTRTFVDYTHVCATGVHANAAEFMLDKKMCIYFIYILSATEHV